MCVCHYHSLAHWFNFSSFLPSPSFFIGCVFFPFHICIDGYTNIFRRVSLLEFFYILLWARALVHIFRVEYTLEFWGTHSTTTADADCFMKQRLTIDVNVTCNDFFGNLLSYSTRFSFFLLLLLLFSVSGVVYFALKIPRPWISHVSRFEDGVLSYSSTLFWSWAASPVYFVLFLFFLPP